MRRHLIHLCVITLFISVFSCEKAKNEPEPGVKQFSFCNRLVNIRPDSVIIPDEDYKIAVDLFERNSIGSENLQIIKLKSFSGYFYVYCQQYFNNLKVFTNGITYSFKDNLLNSHLGQLVDTIPLDTIMIMDRQEVISAFVSQFYQDGMGHVLQFEIDSLNTCFDLEFGYYNLNAGHSYTEPVFTKAWKVKPQGLKYPYAFYNDVNSVLINYDNGIRF